MRTRLDSGTAQVIPEEIGRGNVGGRSYLVLPRFTPLASGRFGRRIERWRMGPLVMDWLRQAAAQSPPASCDQLEHCRQALLSLENLSELPDQLRGDVRAIRRKLELGSTLLKLVPMHGDLWTENIMRRRDGTLAFIDWAGSLPEGYGIYDLIRVASSFRISRSRLRSELAFHAQVLGDGSDEVVKLHLLGAFGHIALNLNQFPPERFAALASNCYKYLSKAIP